MPTAGLGCSFHVAAKESRRLQHEYQHEYQESHSGSFIEGSDDSARQGEIGGYQRKSVPPVQLAEVSTEGSEKTKAAIAKRGPSSVGSLD